MINVDKIIKLFREIFLISFIAILLSQSSFASLSDGTNTFPRYFVVLVHGIGGNYANWTDKKYSEIKNININDVDNYNLYGGFKKYIEKPIHEGGLGLKGYVYAYSFSSSPTVRLVPTNVGTRSRSPLSPDKIGREGRKGSLKV